ncbi:MAG TPA: hypothetical protein VH351_18115 [Bryobacteraceae bacterium]|jgi:hypothetical protein|nr:hypothetical protein [Bryobacteraceae bacterium]
MEDKSNNKADQAEANVICRQCGCTQALAAADARAVGYLNQFIAGTYTCCQVVEWADEQWVAWQDAASEDGKSIEEATTPLEIEPDAQFVPVRLRKPKL